MITEYSAPVFGVNEPLKAALFFTGPLTVLSVFDMLLRNWHTPFVVAIVALVFIIKDGKISTLQ